MKPIVTLTANPTVDVTATVDKVEPTHKLRCSEPRREPGGGGINVARVIRELGGRAQAILTAGGPTGETLQRLLEDAGIDQRIVPIRGHTRESFAVNEDASGKQFRFILPGPELSAEEWRGCLDALGGCETDYVVASGSLPPGAPEDFYARACRIARKIGARFVLDASGPALRKGLEGCPYLIKPSRRELQSLTDRGLEDERRQEAAARELVEAGRVEVVALTLGTEGALLVWRDGQLRLGSPKVERKSAVGAGDSFVGGMTFRLAEGWDLEDAFRYAIASGAAALLTPGTGLCRREDAERLYRELTGRT